MTEAFSSQLLAWGGEHHRDLPWRHSRDGWEILVSEVMLQQTQVHRVVAKYLAFVERFPTPAACAASSSGEVLKLWVGLGYNSRALRLHGSALQIVERFEGLVPRGRGDLLSLPGVGPYTARAVQAFAFEIDVAVVDVNVSRLLSRWHNRRLRGAELQAAADAPLEPGRSWEYNQAILDLGASVCTARNARCEDCPFSAGCAWYATGNASPDPAAGTSSRQSRFEGSDRQGRGRLVAALAQGPVSGGHLAATMGWPDDLDRATRVAGDLVDEQLIQLTDDAYLLS